MTGGHPIPRGFLERARREAERYGDDPWILLRELVQNSRDAGAARIAFLAKTEAGRDQLSCLDDGSGMTRREMRLYLLRLYASGKAKRGETEAERVMGPVGRFGVGFWSVLRFAPDVVRVESCSPDGERTAFEVDCAQRLLREVPCRLTSPGTRVTLVRASTGEPFAKAAKGRLAYWAAHVDGVQGAAPPRLTFNDDVVNASLELPKLIGERVKGKGFDGVVGLGRKPSVRLYSHGLLIRDAASLEELLPKRRGRADLDTPGLYPVVRVNADGLEVLMNRREVVEDRLLEDIVSTSEKRLVRMRRRLLDRLAPLRLLDRVRVAGPRLAVVALALALPVAAGAAASALIDDEGRAAPAALTRRQLGAASSFDLARGARINQPSLTLDGGEVWDVAIENEGLHLVKVATLSRFDPALGLVADAPRVVDDEVPRPPAGSGGVRVRMGVSGEGPVVALPVPSGHAVVGGRALVDGQPLALKGGEQGEPLLVLPARGASTVRYQTVPIDDDTAPSAQLLEAPASWPPAVEGVVERARRSSPVARAAILEGQVKDLVRYSTSLDDAARFDGARGTFVERTLSTGVGDCDVMNGLFALLLRASGTPARVAVGLVAEDGVVAPDLHAWTELWERGAWRALDVSPTQPVGLAGDAPLDEGEGVGVARPAQRVPLERATAALVVEPRPSSGATRLSWLERARTLPLATLGGAFAGFGAWLFVVALVQLASLRRRHDDDDDALRGLLWHWLQGPRGVDPLYLRYRPFFPTTTGKRRLSLADLERLAARGRLFAARPSDPLLAYLSPRVPVIDQARAGVAELLAMLPDVIALDELRAVVRGDVPPLLAEVEAALRLVDDGVRVHVAHDATFVREAELPVRERGLPPRHLLVGGRDPRWQKVLAETAGLRPALARFRVARFLLEQTTLYRHQRDGILAQLAREATT